MNTVRIINADVLKGLAHLPDGSARCCVTSPPYWGLRDYKGGDDMIGLEPTFDLWLERMVAVFTAVRRVLADDGTLWVNMGDSYCGSWGNYNPTGNGGQRLKSTDRFKRRAYDGEGAQMRPPTSFRQDGIKEKDLVGQPWALAFALRADGWWLRSDIIWSKPNPMPESITDRPTKAHEYLFLLSKSQRYFYDNEAIKEPVSEATIGRLMQPSFDQQGEGPKDPLNGGEGSANRSARKAVENMKKRMPAGWDMRQGSHNTLTWNTDSQRSHGPNSRMEVNRVPDREGQKLPKVPRKATGLPNEGVNRGMPAEPLNTESMMRNKRTVWEIATQPCKEAHFATFPEALVKPCILAGSAPGDTVLDPFCGSGTTGIVASKLGRAFVGIELNPEYAAMAERRINATQPGLVM